MTTRDHSTIILEKTAAYVQALEAENAQLRAENDGLKEAKVWHNMRRVEELLKTADVSYGPTLLNELCNVSFDEAQRMVQTLSRSKAASAPTSLGSAEERRADRPANIYDEMTARLQAVAF